MGWGLPCALWSAKPHPWPPLSLPRVVTIINVCRRGLRGSGQNHPLFENHWTGTMASGGGRALQSFLLFMAKWKGGANSCQPRGSRISGLALQGCLLVATTSPPQGNQRIRGNVITVPNGWVYGFPGCHAWERTRPWGAAQTGYHPLGCCLVNKHLVRHIVDWKSTGRDAGWFSWMKSHGRGRSVFPPGGAASHTVGQNEKGITLRLCGRLAHSDISRWHGHSLAV